MTTSNFREFPVDNASILFLSLIRPHHTNIFRFSAKLRHPIQPEALQKAVNRIHYRFPSVVAGLRQDFFHYRQVAAAEPPVVQPDPGLLIPMTAQELRTCAFRVYYQDTSISLEIFHALTDGSGAVVTLTALLTEYLHLTKEADVSAAGNLPALIGEPQSYETSDDYLALANVPSQRLPSRYAYQPARSADADWQVRPSSLSVDTKLLLDAAHRHGVTLNTLLTTVMASSLMDLQIQEKGGRGLKPVRIMVPVNLRKLIGSRTLRNFSLYSLPTMEARHHSLPIRELCHVIGAQLKQQLSQEFLSGVVANNVRMQNAWYFRMLPWFVKKAALRIGYRFVGESNSSVTLTNLGVVKLPEEIQSQVEDFSCWMTPRVGSPYGCTILSYGDKVTLNMSRFCPEDTLGALFFNKIGTILSD